MGEDKRVASDAAKAVGNLVFNDEGRYQVLISKKGFQTLNPKRLLPTRHFSVERLRENLADFDETFSEFVMDPLHVTTWYQNPNM